MRNEILQFVKDHPRATFAKLEREFPRIKGNLPFALARHPQIVYWDGMSEEGIRAIKALLKSNKIHFKVSNIGVYKMDGRALQLPLMADEQAEYSEPHWFPVALFAGSQETHERPVRNRPSRKR